MIIKQNKELESFIINRIKDNWINKVRTDVALTDLIYPRETFFKRKFPMEPSEREILDFLRGKSIEEGLGKLLKLDHPESKKNFGIFYNPDFRFKLEDKDIIMELKSRRSYLAKEGEEIERYKYYIEQIKGYCVLDEINEAYLTIFAIAEKADDGWKTEPKIVSYKLEFTEEDLQEHKEKLMKNSELLIKALESNDFSNLQECDEYRCGKVLKEMIDKPLCLTCKKEFSNEHFAKKHPYSKTGKDHKIKPGKYNYSFEPNCKYIEQCKPKIWKNIYGK